MLDIGADAVTSTIHRLRVFARVTVHAKYIVYRVYNFGIENEGVLLVRLGFGSMKNKRGLESRIKVWCLWGLDWEICMKKKKKEQLMIFVGGQAARPKGTCEGFVGSNQINRPYRCPWQGVHCPITKPDIQMRLKSQITASASRESLNDSKKKFWRAVQFCVECATAPQYSCGKKAAASYPPACCRFYASSDHRIMSGGLPPTTPLRFPWGACAQARSYAGCSSLAWRALHAPYLGGVSGEHLPSPPEKNPTSKNATRGGLWVTRPETARSTPHVVLQTPPIPWPQKRMDAIRNVFPHPP